MTHPESHLTELDDDRLAELAREWRTRALHGEKAAYGAAQAFEAEMRRRKRDSAPQPLSLAQVCAPTRPWWRFW